MTRWERTKDWVKRLLDMFRRPLPPPMPEQQVETSAPSPPQPQPQTGQDPGQQRYQILNQNQSTAGGADSLTDAHDKWTQLTKQNGKIIDTTTGQDVTPQKDDKGRYVVFDAAGTQLESYDRPDKALDAWDKLTNASGRVIDSRTGQDITPRQYLTREQLGELHGLLGSRGIAGLHSWDIDPDLVARMTEQINRLPVPAFDIANIKAQRGEDIPTHTVPIKRREVKIVTKRQVVEIEEVTTEQSHRNFEEVPYPTDELDQRSIRRASELNRVKARDFALPEDEFARSFAEHKLRVPVYEEETTEARQTVRKRKVWRDVEVPEVHEWIEDVEVSDEPKAQLLDIVIDASGSMEGVNMHLAIAMATIMIAKHLDDGSRYAVRWFADDVGKRRVGDTPSSKRVLIERLINERSHNLGGGTYIIQAVTETAKDVRKDARKGDQPEILLITDGGDSFTADDVYQAIGRDVLLHTIIVGYSSNDSLRAHSSSYYHLDWDNNQVVGTTY